MPQKWKGFYYQAREKVENILPKYLDGSRKDSTFDSSTKQRNAMTHKLSDQIKAIQQARKIFKFIHDDRMEFPVEMQIASFDEFDSRLNDAGSSLAALNLNSDGSIEKIVCKAFNDARLKNKSEMIPGAT